MTKRRARRGGCLFLLGAALIAGCGGDRAPARGTGAVLWVTEASVRLSSAELGTLRRAGAEELFVEVAELEWDGGFPSLRELGWYEPIEPMAATLVLRGGWPRVAPEGEEMADRLLPGISDLLLTAPGYGLDVRGVHFDLDRPADEAAGEGLAEALEALRDDVEGPIAWSATVDPDTPALEEIADAADFLVAFAYGERPRDRGGERPGEWRVSRAVDTLRSMEALGAPYLLGAVTLGWARIDEGDPITRTGLAQLAWDRKLTPGLGFTLEGGDRQTYRFVSEGSTFLGGVPVRSGQTVSVTSTSSSHLAALVEAIEAEAGDRFRGLALHRLGGPGEGLALPPASLAHGLAGDSVLPRPVVTATGERRGRGRWTVEVILAEEAGEATDLGFVDTNYVEVAFPEGAWAESVEPGNFYRYELLRREADGRTRPSLRNPNVIRLYAPVLPAGERLRSGPVRIRNGGGHLPLQISGSFLAPYGREVAIAPEVIEPGTRPASTSGDGAD